MIAAATWVEGPIQKIMETIKHIHGPQFYEKYCPEESNNNSIKEAVVLETVEVYKSSQIIKSFNVGIVGIKCYNDDIEFNAAGNDQPDVFHDIPIENLLDDDFGDEYPYEHNQDNHQLNDDINDNHVLDNNDINDNHIDSVS